MHPIVPQFVPRFRQHAVFAAFLLVDAGVVDRSLPWTCMSAKSLAELKRFRDAVDRCGVGLAIDPKSPELAWMAGWCEYQQGHREDAIAWSWMSLAIGHAGGRPKLAKQNALDENARRKKAIKWVIKDQKRLRRRIPVAGATGKLCDQFQNRLGAFDAD